MKSLSLFCDLADIKSEECFLNSQLQIETAPSTQKIHSVFNHCLNEVKPYITYLLAPPPSIDCLPVINSDSKIDSNDTLLNISNTLEINCALSALQTFTYFSKKDNYTSFEDIVRQITGDEYDPNLIKKRTRLIHESSADHYLNRFLDLKNRDGHLEINDTCYELAAELILMNQKPSTSSKASHELIGLSKVIPFNRDFKQLKNPKKTKTSWESFLSDLFMLKNREDYPFLLPSENTVESLLYCYSRELVFRSNSILTYILNSKFDTYPIATYAQAEGTDQIGNIYGDEIKVSFNSNLQHNATSSLHYPQYHDNNSIFDWICGLQSYAAIPFTQLVPELTAAAPQILQHSPLEITAGFTVLLKSFCISLFNANQGCVDSCIKILQDYLHPQKASLLDRFLTSYTKTDFNQRSAFLYSLTPQELSYLNLTLLCIYQNTPAFLRLSNCKISSAPSSSNKENMVFYFYSSLVPNRPKTAFQTQKRDSEYLSRNY